VRKGIMRKCVPPASGEAQYRRAGGVNPPVAWRAGGVNPPVAWRAGGVNPPVVLPGGVNPPLAERCPNPARLHPTTDPRTIGKRTRSASDIASRGLHFHLMGRIIVPQGGTPHGGWPTARCRGSAVPASRCMSNRKWRDPHTAKGSGRIVLSTVGAPWLRSSPVGVVP